STWPPIRALLAVTWPLMRLSGPCTSAAQPISPSTLPSICRSTLASILPWMATSPPMIEKGVCLAPVAIGDAALGELLDFENILPCLQKGARIDRRAVDAHFE